MNPATPSNSHNTSSERDPRPCRGRPSRDSSSDSDNRRYHSATGDNRRDVDNDYATALRNTTPGPAQRTMRTVLQGASVPSWGVVQTWRTSPQDFAGAIGEGASAIVEAVEEYHPTEPEVIAAAVDILHPVDPDVVEMAETWRPIAQEPINRLALAPNCMLQFMLYNCMCAYEKM